LRVNPLTENSRIFLLQLVVRVFGRVSHGGYEVKKFCYHFGFACALQLFGNQLIRMASPLSATSVYPTSPLRWWPVSPSTSAQHSFCDGGCHSSRTQRLRTLQSHLISPHRRIPLSVPLCCLLIESISLGQPANFQCNCLSLRPLLTPFSRCSWQSHSHDIVSFPFASFEKDTESEKNNRRCTQSVPCNPLF
jgi:hypothetical protein